jgi:hypothetical protein
VYFDISTGEMEERRERRKKTSCRLPNIAAAVEGKKAEKRRARSSSGFAAQFVDSQTDTRSHYGQRCLLHRSCQRRNFSLGLRNGRTFVARNLCVEKYSKYIAECTHNVSESRKLDSFADTHNGVRSREDAPKDTHT